MEIQKTLDEINACVLLFNLRHVIHIHSFRIVNLLCSGGRFSSIIFIDAKPKYRSPYLLNVSQSYLQNHIRTSLGHPRGVSEGRPQDVGWTRRQGTSLGVTYRILWGGPQDFTLGRPKDVIFQRPKDGGRGRSQDVSRKRPLALHRARYGTFIERLLGTSSGRPRDIILPSGQDLPNNRSIGPLK